MSRITAKWDHTITLDSSGLQKAVVIEYPYSAMGFELRGTWHCIGTFFFWPPLELEKPSLSTGTCLRAEVGASAESSCVPATDWVTADWNPRDGSPPEVCMWDVSSPEPTAGLVSTSEALGCSLKLGRSPGSSASPALQSRFAEMMLDA